MTTTPPAASRGVSRPTFSAPVPLPALGAFLLSLAALASCEEDPEIRAEGTADAAVRPEDLVCPKGLPGAELIRVQTKDDLVFCMDQREVTWGEYDAFLAAKKGDVGGQPPECAWNAGYEPEYYVLTDINHSPQKCEEKFRPTSKDQAANCLDFCDAHAYCAWAGKRLCGVLGAKVPEGGVDSVASPVFDAPIPLTEIVYACSQGQTSEFAYGDSYVEGRCVNLGQTFRADAGPPTITDVAGSECRGSSPPFDDVYDLGGSVSEWQNHCEGPEASGCVTSGSGAEGVEAKGCSSEVGFTAARAKNPSIGLRCCADAEPGRAATN